MSPSEWLVVAFVFGLVCGWLLARATAPYHTPPPLLRVWRRGSAEMLSTNSPGEGWSADPPPDVDTAARSGIFAALRVDGMTESHVEQMRFGEALRLLQLYQCRLQISGDSLVWLEPSAMHPTTRMEHRGANGDAQLFAYAVRCIAVRREWLQRKGVGLPGVTP